MIVCGIELSGSEARLVVLSGTKENYSHIATSTPKIILHDDENQDEVKFFRETVYAFLRENGIERVAIKKRGKRGKFAGGAVSFKMEGVIQLYLDGSVTLVPSQAISTAKRKHSPSLPCNIKQYQHTAFDTAFAILD